MSNFVPDEPTEEFVELNVIEHEQSNPSQEWTLRACWQISPGVIGIIRRCKRRTATSIPPHNTGYVAFADEGLLHEDDGDIDVHGGITYRDEDRHYAVYGFDCNHVQDQYNPLLQDINWLRAEVERLAEQVDALYKTG